MMFDIRRIWRSTRDYLPQNSEYNELWEQQEYCKEFIRSLKGSKSVQAFEKYLQRPLLLMNLPLGEGDVVEGVENDYNQLNLN